MFEAIRYFFKYKFNFRELDVNPQDYESRRNWILYVANRDKKYPVSEINAKFEGLVSKVTINKDFQKLEEEGLIRREKDRATGKSYVIPEFQDSGVSEGTRLEQRKQFLLSWGLPIIAVILFCMLGLVIFMY